MSPPSRTPPAARPARGRAVMRPRFTLAMLYLFGFFFLFCLILVLPALIEVLRSVTPGPEQEAAAHAAAREAARGKLGLAFAMATAATGIGMLKGWLPGTRS